MSAAASKSNAEPDDDAVSRRRPVEKVIQLLTCMVDDESTQWGVRELARRLGWSPSTAHRVLSDLDRLGLVQLDPESAQYSLGLEFFRLAWKGTMSVPFATAAAPSLRRLVDELDETACLSLYDRGRRQMLFAASAESTQDVRYVVTLNQWLPVVGGASGIAIIAFLSDSELSTLLSQYAKSKSFRDAAPVAKIRADVERARQVGYSITSGQRVPGAVGVAAPVFGASGKVIGSVGLTMPELRFDPANEKSLALAVRRAAAQITADLGGPIAVSIA